MGNSVTLTAVTGRKATSGTIISVAFYQDANGNGQYDSGDKLLGSTSNDFRRRGKLHARHQRVFRGHVPFLAVVTDARFPLDYVVPPSPDRVAERSRQQCRHRQRR